MVSDGRPCAAGVARHDGRDARCYRDMGEAPVAQLDCLAFAPRPGDPGAVHLAALPGSGDDRRDARQLPGCVSAMTRGAGLALDR
jgi:hypothetical protein